MDSKFFEKELLKYFSEVIYVDSNPAILKYENVYKQNGKLKVEKKEEKINLKSLIIPDESKDLMSPKYESNGLVDYINDNSLAIEFKYYPSNIIDKIIKRKDAKLNTFISNKVTINNYILTNSKISEVIKRCLDNEIYQIECKRMDNKIVIGKKAPIYLLKDYNKLNNESVEVLYFFDFNNFNVVNLV